MLVVLLVTSMGLLPLACSSSTADSKKEEEEAAAEAEEEKETYDVPEYTGDRTVEQRLSDASLATQIRQALVRERDLRLFDFDPEVEGETVTLRGDVNTRAQRTKAEHAAERAARGRTVVNEITIGGRPADEVEDESAADGSDDEGESTSTVYHTVQRGENLWEIARQHNASVERIRSLNNLSSDGLQVGQRIRVR